MDSNGLEQGLERPKKKKKAPSKRAPPTRKQKVLHWRRAAMYRRRAKKGIETKRLRGHISVLYPGFRGGNRVGIPNGMRRPEAEKLWAEARAKAEVIYQVMVEKGIAPPLTDENCEEVTVKGLHDEDVIVKVPKTDEGKAGLALKMAVVEMLSPLTKQSARQAAIRTVLEWTKAKPASKSEVTVNKAEEWLAQVMAEAKNDK